MNIPMAVQNCRICGGTGLMLISAREPGGLHVRQTPCGCVEYLQIRFMPVLVPAERPQHQNHHLLPESTDHPSTMHLRAWGTLLCLLVILILVLR